MSLFFERNPLFLALITLSLVAIGEARAPAAHNDDPDSIIVLPKVRVEMFNMLPNNTDLTIHCKSKDDDLGTHVIGPGQQYGFKFRVNFWGTTLFFCGASWQGGQAVFDIFSSKRDSDRCFEYCKWEARGNFIFGFKPDNPIPDLVIGWTH